MKTILLTGTFCASLLLGCSAADPGSSNRGPVFYDCGNGSDGGDCGGGGDDDGSGGGGGCDTSLPGYRECTNDEADCLTACARNPTQATREACQEACDEIFSDCLADIGC
jgi:hypothetical protein